MNKVELQEALRLHKLWLNAKPGGIRAGLSKANLSNANLSYTDLRGADLSYTDLRGTNLSNVDLRCAVGNNKEIKSLQIGTYLISYTAVVLNIGCESHSIKKWACFSDERIASMDEEALEFWNLNKHIILELCNRGEGND